MNLTAFVLPYLDYGDALYDQAFNSAFHDKLESIQVQCMFSYNWSN